MTGLRVANISAMIWSPNYAKLVAAVSRIAELLIYVYSWHLKEESITFQLGSCDKRFVRTGWCAVAFHEGYAHVKHIKF